MLEESCNYIGLEIYSPKGIFVGKVTEIVIDTDSKRISGIMVAEPNPALVDKGVIITIPYRWVQSVGDIIILNSFPEHVNSDGSYIS